MAVIIAFIYVAVYVLVGAFLMGFTDARKFSISFDPNCWKIIFWPVILVINFIWSIHNIVTWFYEQGNKFGRN